MPGRGERRITKSGEPRKFYSWPVATYAEENSIELLEEGLQRRPEAASLYHQLGVSRVHQKDLPGALASLGEAARLEPDYLRYSYVHAVALNSSGRHEQAIAMLQDIHARFPEDRLTLYALATIRRDQGKIESARRWAHKLLALDPQDPQARQLAESLK